MIIIFVTTIIVGLKCCGIECSTMTRSVVYGLTWRDGKNTSEAGNVFWICQTTIIPHAKSSLQTEVYPYRQPLLDLAPMRRRGTDGETDL